MAENGHPDDALTISKEIENSLYQIYGFNRVAVAITGHVFEEYV